MPSNTKKISVLLDLQFIRQMEDVGLSQTEAVTEALNYYFSEDRQRIEIYKNKISSDAQKIAVLEARISDCEAHRETIERELKQVHSEYQAHLGQVQTLILQVEEKRRLLYDEKKKSFFSRFKFW